MGAMIAMVRRMRGASTQCLLTHSTCSSDPAATGDSEQTGLCNPAYPSTFRTHIVNTGSPMADGAVSSAECAAALPRRYTHPEPLQPCGAGRCSLHWQEQSRTKLELQHHAQTGCHQWRRVGSDVFGLPIADMVPATRRKCLVAFCSCLTCAVAVISGARRPGLPVWAVGHWPLP